MEEAKGDRKKVLVVLVPLIFGVVNCPRYWDYRSKEPSTGKEPASRRSWKKGEDKGVGREGGKRKIGSETRVSRNTAHFVARSYGGGKSEAYETKG